MSYAIDLEPFYEEVSRVKPAIQGSVVSNGKDFFHIDRWFKGSKHCYVLICKARNWKPFAKKPSEITEMIASGKLQLHSI